KNISHIAKTIKHEKKGEIFIAPRAIDEFLSFFEDKNQQFIKDFTASITIKSPDIHKVEIPNQAFYLLVDDIKQRSLRGLNIAEDEINNAGRLFMGKKELSQKDFQIQIGEIVRKFRDRYRNATRTGFLDSLTDLDCITLAKEQDGTLISTDEGVLKWARVFGVKEMPAAAWKKQMSDLFLHHPE
ncbi:RNA ligase partner protein, partial [Candidatus Roizmanbacteria bacterium]|nr:RNA ligase partner protein [Candidatus Roizmanbacteria bacterium]